MILFSQFAAILLVFALLGGFVWVAARKRLLVPGFASGRDRGIQQIDQLRLTPQVSLHLVRCRDLEILVAAAPNGCSVTEIGEANSPS